MEKSTFKIISSFEPKITLFKGANHKHYRLGFRIFWNKPERRLHLSADGEKTQVKAVPEAEETFDLYLIIEESQEKDFRHFLHRPWIFLFNLIG